MTLPQTKAATYLQEHVAETISAHKVISLLLDGALERIEQAIDATRCERDAEVVLLTEKLVAILEGLRNSLDRQAGGEIAENLNDLYEYMVRRLKNARPGSMEAVLLEAQRLLGEVKEGWDNMDSSII